MPYASTQTDVGERSQQFAMMGSIYEGAQRVIVWLVEPGPVNPFTLRRVFESRGKWSFSNWMQRLYQDRRVSRLAYRNYDKALDEADKNTSPHWQDRAWVAQEFALARDVVFLFGQRRACCRDLSFFMLRRSLLDGNRSL